MRCIAAEEGPQPQSVLAPKWPSSVAKRATKQIMICFVPYMLLHPVSTPVHTRHTAINHVIIVLEQSSLTRHTPLQLGFMQRSPIPMYKS